MRRLLGARLREQHGELVAAEPRQQIGLAQPLAEHRGDRADQLVPCRMAEGVVHVLEVVEVQQQHGALASVARVPREVRLELVLEAAPVGEAGERIMVGEVLEPALEALALRDVLGVDDEVGRAPLVVAQQRAADERPDRVAEIDDEV